MCWDRCLSFPSGGCWPPAQTLPSCASEEPCWGPLPQPLMPLAEAHPPPSDPGDVAARGVLGFFLRVLFSSPA